MVDGLLRYAELGRQPIKPRPVSLAAEVSAIAAALDEQGAGRRLHWEIGPLPEVHADPALLRLVLHNVIDNAVKYTRSREEARIEVSARLADRAVEVTVRDNGIGFDMAYAAKLFAPFERLHDAAEYDGTGIGLAHARRIVERHGGRMWCEAAPGNGAAFTLSLPH
jgi:light-regulated signal transduction histidine kinase (bacteriophytochrome)